MKKMRSILAFILVALMAFSLVGCGNSKNSDSETTTPTTAEETSKQEETTTVEPTTEPKDIPTELTVVLHFLKADGDYDKYDVWLWPDGGDGKEYAFDGAADDKGVSTTVKFPAGTSKIGFIVRCNGWEKKDVDKDQFIELEGIIAGTVDVYVTSGNEGCEIVKGEDCVTGLSVKTAELDGDFKTVKVTFTEEYTDGHTILVKDAAGAELAIDSIKKDDSAANKASVILKEEVDKFGTYKISLDGLEFDVTVPSYFSTDAFEEEFTYKGDDLGATWSKDSTTFKVWAPTAAGVSVNTYKSGLKNADDLIDTYEMTKEAEGVWSVKVDGDLNGVYYLYAVSVASGVAEACDPYARAVGVNGDRAMVVDLESTNPDGWDKDKNPNSDLKFTDCSVWEVHVRDFSIDASSGMTNAGKYLAFTETGTKNPTGQSTGIDYLKELGVTHVQLGPVYDYATVDETKLDSKQYNWGYDPKNYNAPEGSYSTDPTDGAVRIKEFKQMVQSLHNNGMSVVMDVVYNHTYNTSYCFNQIVPDYFYRPGSNGSGCGNDVASERAMVSKFIVDSVTYWAKEYHIDGFRFDLVGLLDVETINAVRAAVDKIDPSIILYGEGWSMSTATTKADVELATQIYVPKMPGFAMFSDTIRDAIKGSVFNASEKGYVNGNISKTGTIKNAIMGKTDWSDKGNQNVVYSSCHDNNTLWDLINTSNKDDSFEEKVKQNLLSAAITYTSQGMPFILAGEEILRTKTNADGTFNHNSYNASDAVNSIKWESLVDVAYQNVFNYYKGMIELRKAHAAFRVMDKAKDYYTFTEGTEKGVIAYELKGVDGEVADSIFVVYNPLSAATTVELPAGDWTIIAQGDKAGTESLGTATGSVTVDSISCTVLVKGATK